MPQYAGYAELESSLDANIIAQALKRHGQQ